MKVALVLCPAWSREMPHLALALLSACLRKDGHQVFIFDFNNDFYHNCIGEYKSKWKKAEDEFWVDCSSVSKFISENEQIINRAVKQILASNAQIIGFSVYYPTELMSLELARRIKQLDKERIIVFGGAQCLRELKGQIFIENEIVDVIVIGEGEETLLELARIIDRNKTTDFCEGILFKRNAEVIDCGNRAPIMDLDSLPLCDFTDFPLSLYEYPSTLPLLSSRGCIQHCVFCTVGISWKRYRCMSGKRLFQEMEHQLKLFKNVDNFHFYDPLINGNIEELSGFCDLIIESKKQGKLPAIKWRGEAIIRPQMGSDILRKMKEAGCYDLSYGIESGSQKVLDRMKKHFKIADAERIIRQTHAVGIKVTLNFMFGFPTETNEDFEKTLDFMSKNSKYIDEVLPSDSFCSIERNSYLYNHPEEFDIVSPIHSAFWETADGKNTYPERLRRFESFCELATSLNINLGIGYEKHKLNKEQNLDNYFDYKKEPQKKRILKSKDPISFSWDLHYACNYNCPYCWWDGKWQELARLNRCLSVEQWIKYWRNIYLKYSSVIIEVLGGEPFIYPNFTALIKQLSNMHNIRITTNLSTDIEEFIRQVDSSRVKVFPTYHPLFAEFSSFVKKALLLKENGFTDNINYLAYPAQIKQIPYYKERFNQLGLSFSLMTFWGEYKGITYPDGYTEAERETIGVHLGKRADEEFQLIPKKLPRNRLCRAGQSYAVIQSNGNVLRCGGSGLNETIGNFFDENFRLLDRPLPCQAKYCKCNEWAFLLE